MIHHIVFDKGEVLIRWRPELLAAQAGVPEEDVPTLCRAVFGSVEWIQLDRGTISREDALKAMCRELPERPRAEAEGLGYGIYLLSNASSELHGYFCRIPGSQYFDGKIVSADWKLLKPQHEIYETLFREYGLQPEECFFIDDVPANIEGARYAGMNGVVFDGDPSHLRGRLKSAGILV